MVNKPLDSDKAEEISFHEDGVVYAGQTIGDGSCGRVLFGRDSKGGMHIQIVCDKRPTGGIVQVNNIEIPDGYKYAKWLYDWFCVAPPAVTILGCS